MKVKEFLKIMREKHINGDITFTIANAVKDKNTPFYHFEFYQTPIRCFDDWESWKEDYIVINPSACPIDITGGWQKRYMKGHILNAILTTEKDFYTMYSESQAKEMIEWYDKEVRQELNC